MIVALIVVAVLLFVAVVLLSNAFGSVSTENSIRSKISAFDAAEAGINQVVEVLDKSNGTNLDCAGDPQAVGKTGSTLADGGSFSWCIQWNAFVRGKGLVKDHQTQADVTVPNGMIYAWSSGMARDGGRGVLIEAMIAPSSGLALPTGAIDAAGDVYSRAAVSILESVASTSDPVIRANGNIYQTVAPRFIQGNTYAAGIDQISGANGTNPNSPSMPFPSPDQVAAATENAGMTASSTAMVISPPANSTVLTGDVYINGGLDLQSGTVVFEHGKSVFINGNLCLQDRAQVVNDGATIWVNGVVSTVGTGGGYSVAPGSSGTLVAIGADNGAACPNSSSKLAVILGSSATSTIGFVYAPNGSIDLTGTGMLVGAIDAGHDIYLDSARGGGLSYDPNVVQPIPTYDFKVVSYMEY